MKALKKNGLGGGLVAALLVMAVLGLFSLTGCSNTSEGASGPNLFLGEWVYTTTETFSYVTVKSIYTLRFESDGQCTWILREILNAMGSETRGSKILDTYKYTVNADTATLSPNGIPTAKITLNPDGKSFWYDGFIYTKQEGL